MFLLYKQRQDSDAITEENKKKFYPQNVDSLSPMANKDFHIAFHGEIVSAYIIE